jgi:hypothetical protein
MKRWSAGMIVLGLGLGCVEGVETVVARADFEGLSLEAPAVQAYDGPGGGVFYNGSDESGGFESGGFNFGNSYTVSEFGAFWSGWAYSTTTDVETAGFTNQYSAWPGSAGGGSVYGIGFLPATIELPAGLDRPDSIKVANSTYAAIAMRDGDAFARAFGDDPATVDVVESDFPDTFELRIFALDGEANELGMVSVFLADFRSPVDGEDIIRDDWLEVNLAPLGGGVRSLRLELVSTDAGAFGNNTPSYVAIDDLRVSGFRWAGFVEAGEGYFDTGDWLGLVYPLGDYVYVLKLERWFYLPEATAADPGGSWVWIPR